MNDVKAAQWNPEQLLGFAKANCKRCYGRGFDGILKDGAKHVCACVLNKLHRAQKPGKVRIVANATDAPEVKIDPADIF